MIWEAAAGRGSNRRWSGRILAPGVVLSPGNKRRTRLLLEDGADRSSAMPAGGDIRQHFGERIAAAAQAHEPVGADQQARPATRPTTRGSTVKERTGEGAPAPNSNDKAGGGEKKGSFQYLVPPNRGLPREWGRRSSRY